MSDVNQSEMAFIFKHWGLWAVMFGALAVALVFLQMQLLSMQEAAPIGQQIGEIAGEIKRNAWRSFFGLSPPEPEPVPASRDMFSIIFATTPFVAGIALVLSVISFLKRENWRLGFMGVALGGGAILFQFAWWMVMVLLGFLLLFKIVENIGDIFSFGG
ncbi:MAG: hypothetical protein AAGL92_09565 [Pseudomonadota bacterium]